MAFCIVTDSASDMPAEIREKYNALVIPTPFVVDGVDYRDGDKTSEEFFAILADPAHDVTTYKINSEMFYEAFEPYAARNDEVLYICFSSGVAGTIDSATLAVNDLHEKYPDFVITIVDSHCASLGFGLLTYKLLKMQENGAPKELIIEAAKAYAGHIPHVFTVETLKYLVKGGRVSKTSGYVGEALDIKPILVIEEDGVIQPKMKVRGRKKSLRALLDYVGEHGVNLENQIVGVVHANDPATCELLISELNKRYHPKEIISGCMGCAIGAHVGQGAVGIVCVDFDDSKYAEYQG